MELTFRKLISFDESISMINEVYNAVFNFESETGDFVYLPELYDYAFRLAVAKYFAGYALSDDETNYFTAMSFNPYNTDIDTLQLTGIEKAISEKIEMQRVTMNKSNITVISQLDDLIPSILKLVATIDDKVSTIDVSKISSFLKEANIENLVKVYLDSASAKNNYHGVLDEKNEKIRVLQDTIHRIAKRNVKSTGDE